MVYLAPAKGKSGRQTSLLDIPIVRIRIPEMPKVPKIPDFKMPKLPIEYPHKKEVTVKVTGPKKEVNILPEKKELQVTVKKVEHRAPEPKKDEPKKIQPQKTIQELKKEKILKAKKKMAGGPGDAAMYPPPKHNANTDEWVGKVHVHPIEINKRKMIAISFKFNKPDYWMRQTDDKLKGFFQNMEEIQKILKNPSKKHEGKIKVWQLGGDPNLTTIDIPISNDKRFMLTIRQAQGVIDNMGDIMKSIKKYYGK